MGGTFDRFKIIPALLRWRVIGSGKPNKCERCGRFVKAYTKYERPARVKLWGFTKTKVDLALDMGVSARRIADAMNLPHDIVRRYAAQRKPDGTDRQ